VLRAVVAGHVCLDLIPSFAGPADLTAGTLVEVGSMVVRPGGCVANTGGDLVALGAPVQLIADVGDDELGRLLPDLLAGIGATPALRAVAASSTSYSIVVQPPGHERTFWHHVGANASFDGSSVDVAGCDLLHVGYPPLLPALAADRGAGLRALLGRARETGVTTSVDLAVVDSSGAAGREDWAAILRETLPLTDVFTPSIDDLASALDRAFPASPEALAAAADELVAAGAAVVALTAGPEGMLLRTAGRDRLRAGGRALRALGSGWADRELWVPVVPGPVTTTIGAGDAATAGLLYAVLAGLGPEDAALAAAGAAALKVAGQRPLPRYGDSGIPALRVTAADRDGWTRAARGLLAGPADAAACDGKGRAG
jgi:sugar/nucleoside kinase (ribokinase family)